MASSSRLGYRPALDGVRALAILVVVGKHAFDFPKEGGLGVDLFFVLSGFLITTLLLEEHAASGRIRLGSFYRRRIRRLFPALLVMLSFYAVATFAVLAVGGNLDAEHLRRPGVGLAGAFSYSSNIILAVDPSAGPHALTHLWSLAQEEQFYVLWPLLLIALLRRRPAALVATLSVLVAAVLAERFALALNARTVDGLMRVYFGPDTHADPILVGCLAAAWHARRGWPLVLAPRARSAAAAVGITLVAAAFLFTDGIFRLLYGTPLLTLVAAAAALLIVSVASGDSLVARALSLRPLAGLGRISYSLYLWHVPLLAAVGGHQGSPLAEPGRAAAVVAAVVLAILSRRFVELPFLRRRPRDAGIETTPAAPAPVLAT